MDQKGIDVTIRLGDLVVALYDAFLEEYGDEELAMGATAALLEERYRWRRSAEERLIDGVLPDAA
jgi:hypothetical protein